MKKLKNALYAGAGLSLLAINSVSAIGDQVQPDPEIRVDWSADTVIQKWIWTAMTFLMILAVIYGLWGGFNILTAAWDEEKVKTGKKVLINAVIWLLVIFLAGSIMQWVFWIIQWTT